VTFSSASKEVEDMVISIDNKKSSKNLLDEGMKDIPSG
jgi:hypothetical protein